VGTEPPDPVKKTPPPPLPLSGHGHGRTLRPSSSFTASSLRPDLAASPLRIDLTASPLRPGLAGGGAPRRTGGGAARRAGGGAPGGGVMGAGEEIPPQRSRHLVSSSSPVATPARVRRMRGGRDDAGGARGREGGRAGGPVRANPVDPEQGM
jgi:hypothetical protein